MITIEPSTEITFTLPLSDDALDNVTATVLAQKYHYGPKHLRRMQREDTLPWRQARYEVRLTLNAALDQGALHTGDAPVVAPAATADTPEPVGPPVISEFQNEHRFLSNFWPFDGTDVSKTAEHAYQSAKTVDPKEEAAIMAAPTPYAAKLLGDQCTMHSQWEEHKVAVMRKIVQLKFELPTLREQLLGTGSAVLIEGNHWCDTFWGCCTCEVHQGAGMNWLGILLMETRNAAQK